LPANLTPQYYAAEESFKKAVSIEEKITALEEMLAVIPKHKGTEKIRADLRRRLSRLRRDRTKKPKTSHVDPFSIERQGAGQAVLFGFPNTGKSSFLAALTRAQPKIADYPFTTTVPLAGMMPYEDVFVQLVDTPPITEDIVPPGLIGTLRNADILLIFVDVASDECLEQLEFCLNYLKDKKIVREDLMPEVHGVSPNKVLVLASKIDQKGSKDNMQIIRELTPTGIAIHPFSTRTGEGLEVLREKIFQMLNVIRVYTKIPGKDPDVKKPFIMDHGSTIMELAQTIHRDLPRLMKNARVWGSARYDGQSVARDYIMADGDIVEISQ